MGLEPRRRRAHRRTRYPGGADESVSGWIEAACATGLKNTQSGLPSTGGSFGCFSLGHAQYVQAMGTSASAPLVAGAAAILRGARPNWTAAQIVDALRTGATRTGSLTEPELNLTGALNATEGAASSVSPVLAR